MKKAIILLAGMIFLAAGTACADNDKPISTDQLPAKAQEFIKKYFPSEKVAYAKMETDILETSYEVTFTTSTKLEFDRGGEWKEVNCRYSSVPEGIVPVQITAKVKELFPDTSVVSIDRDRRDIEVKLNNRMELTFDLNYNLIEIDD